MGQVTGLYVFAPNTIIRSAYVNFNFATIQNVYNAHDSAVSGVHGLTGTQAFSAVCPIGSVIDFAGSTAPTTWLLCYGQTLNSVTSPQYANLYSVIGTTYGGTGAAAFILPDCRGRVGAGRDDMGTVAANRVNFAIC